MGEKKRIVVASLPKPPVKQFDPLEYLAEFCYFYPSYKFAEARRLPYRTVRRLMAQAHKQEAIKNYNLTQIIASPNTKNGEGITELLAHFKDVIDGK